MFKMILSLHCRISPRGMLPLRNRPHHGNPSSPTSTVVVVALAAMVALSIATPAWSEAPNLRREWREMRTPNFVLFGDATERQMREVGDSLESLRSFLDQMSTVGVEAPIPTYIYVFKDRRSFNPYRPLQTNGEPLDVNGFFYRRQHANYIAVDGSRRDAMIGTTLHEFVHFYLSYRTLNIPVWFNEGLAEVYSTFEVVGDHVNIGKIIPQHLHWLQQNTLIPLLQLFAVDHQSSEYNESDRRGVFYAQSWALVHYLFLDLEGGPEKLANFLQLQTTVPTEEAFVQAFGVSPKEMERQLRKYVRSPQFSYRRAKLSIDDLRKSFAFRDMSTSEALARLGEMLAVQGSRRQEATAHLQAALGNNPDEIRAHIGLGLIETEPPGDASAAAPHFSAARRLAPEDRWVIFLEAQARSLRGDPPKDLRQDFVRVVNAHPHFLDAWRLLAWSWGGETENLKEATKVFEAAHRMMPEEKSYAENLLYYYDRSERKEDAEQLMQSFFRPRGLAPQRAFMTFNDPSYTGLDTQNETSVLTQPQQMRGDETVESIERANRLMSEQKYEAALEIYEDLASKRPNATELISKRDDLREAVSHNRFIAGYNEAVRLFGLYQWRRAAEELQELLEDDMSGTNRAKAEKLLAQAKGEWQKRGESGL